MALIGNTRGLFQYSSNSADSRGTIAPATSVSRSMKLAPALTMKYSSAMLRPPATAIAPSAMNSLLCMRRCTRLKSSADAAKRVMRFCRPAGNGLNSRTSTFGCASRPRNSGSAPGGVQVVDQQAHADAAHAGVAQRAQHVAAGPVVVDLVVLDVERALRAARELDPRGERVLARRHEPEAGQLAVGRRRIDDAAERRLRGRRNAPSTACRSTPAGSVAHPAMTGGECQRAPDDAARRWRASTCGVRGQGRGIRHGCAQRRRPAHRTTDWRRSYEPRRLSDGITDGCTAGRSEITLSNRTR